MNDLRVMVVRGLFKSFSLLMLGKKHTQKFSINLRTDGSSVKLC